METINQTTATLPAAHQPEVTEPADDLAANLSLPRKAEIWSGRFAMLGFVTTAMAIALKSTF